jgi:dTDP-4-amino-4,6-dideoxygalactose transaminase
MAGDRGAGAPIPVAAARTGRRDATRVPFLDLSAVHAPLKERLVVEIGELIESAAFTNGPQVGAFERAFADYCGRRHCIGVASGLDALRLSLLAAGTQAGDEVIVPANTFVATLEAVTHARAVPVLVDVTEADYNIDVAAVEAAAGDRTRFVIPVHLYGQLADMVGLAKVVERRRLEIVEDACQAHGAERDGVRAGAAGKAAAFSFYPSNNLGAMGDAGAVVTDDADLAKLVRALGEHGQRLKHEYELEGYTARLDTIQALVLLAKLPHVDSWNDQRRRAAAVYRDVLAGVGDLRLPPVPPGSNPAWHVYAIRTADAASLAAFMRERGIETARHYPQPAHLAPAYAWLGHRAGAFPVSEALAQELLSLPIFPGITDEQLSAVASAIRDFFRRG